MTNNLQEAIQVILKRRSGTNMIGHIQGEFGNIAGIVKDDNLGKTYVVFFIRQWFRKFGTIMRIGSCEGVTIPTHALEKAINMDAIIIFVTPAEVYELEATRFQEFVKNNGTMWKNPRTGIEESGVAVDFLELTNI